MKKNESERTRREQKKVVGTRENDPTVFEMCDLGDRHGRLLCTQTDVGATENGVVTHMALNYWTTTDVKSYGHVSFQLHVASLFLGVFHDDGLTFFENVVVTECHCHYVLS